MRSVHLVSGAGGMYCGSCMHANTLVAALRQAGSDSVLVPLYTPLRLDEEDAGVRQVALGGVNIYLHDRFAWFRHTPRLLTRLLDSPRLLRWVGRRSGSTRPESLGPMTVSMLRGDEGRQQAELCRLAVWLRREIRPQLVHLSNVMLVGIARILRRELDVPIVCSLSGEDVFLERLPEPHYGQARKILAERAAEVDALVAMNRYYADFMADYLAVPRSLVHVIPPGLNLRGHLAELKDSPRTGSAENPVTVGFLARICPEKGLHQLADAFCILASDRECLPLRLVAAGYLGELERPYLKQIESRLGQAGLADRFCYVGEPNRAEKIALLQSFDVLSLPTVYRESKGLPVLEAWANGVPVVVPDHGAFSEMIEQTGGGLLYEAGSTPALAAALKRILTDRNLALDSGRRGWEAVRRQHDAAMLAQRTIELYDRLLSRTGGPGRV